MVHPLLEFFNASITNAVVAILFVLSKLGMAEVRIAEPFNVTPPATVKEPPNVVAPVPTVNVFALLTLTVLLNVLAPVTANVPPKLVAPVPTVSVFVFAIATLSLN